MRFNKIDRNHDGRITREEFVAELRDNGLPDHLADVSDCDRSSIEAT